MFTRHPNYKSNLLSRGHSNLVRLLLPNGITEPSELLLSLAILVKCSQYASRLNTGLAGVSQAGSLCDGQSRCEKFPEKRAASKLAATSNRCTKENGRSPGSNKETCNYVPVVSCTGKPLMPCHPARARELIRKVEELYSNNIRVPIEYISPDIHIYEGSYSDNGCNDISYILANDDYLSCNTDEVKIIWECR